MNSKSILHVDFLGVLFIVWGVLTILIGLSTLALGVGAAALLASATVRRREFAASFTAVTFTTLAIIALVWGAAHVAVGIPLRRRRTGPVSALLLGSVDLVLLPYGTALAAYALWVLLHEDGKRLFDIADPGMRELRIDCGLRTVDCRWNCR